MNCPNCKTVTLVMEDRSAIEIDYGPQCRGVRLDRGELLLRAYRSHPVLMSRIQSIKAATIIGKEEGVFWESCLTSTDLCCWSYFKRNDLIFKAPAPVCVDNA